MIAYGKLLYRTPSYVGVVSDNVEGKVEQYLNLGVRREISWCIY